VIREIKRIKKIENYDQVRIKIASPDVIREWSYGEVVKPDTLNYRTLKPEKGGFFASVFSGLKRTMSVPVENIRKSVSKIPFATVAE